ncbi:MAG: helix-turn-helix transcriptional regulator [Eggerthellaceae bacterium]|nr:helix-turn-helix transcriptional regulator [Eggerthellaceae bacterium]
MINDEYVSGKIRELREAQGVSEMDMTQKMGMPLTLYRVFEVSPSKFPANIDKAAAVLGCTAADLTGEA